VMGWKKQGVCFCGESMLTKTENLHKVIGMQGLSKKLEGLLFLSV